MYYVFAYVHVYTVYMSSCCILCLPTNIHWARFIQNQYFNCDPFFRFNNNLKVSFETHLK